MELFLRELKLLWLYKNVLFGRNFFMKYNHVLICVALELMYVLKTGCYVTILCPSWEELPRYVNNFAVLHAFHMGLLPINSACKYAFYI